jgi:histidinol-phosphatase (PHP family)
VYESYTEKILKRYDFDLVIMSVHFLQHWPEGNWVFNYAFKDTPLDAVYSDYIRTVSEGIKTGLFDILGHIDLIKKPGDSLLEKIPDEITYLLAAVKAAEMTIEINTSGYRKEVGEPYPGFDWLPLLKKKGIAITTGSDAHAAEQVGLNFGTVYKELKRLDFHSLSTFAKRQRIEFLING